MTSYCPKCHHVMSLHTRASNRDESMCGCGCVITGLELLVAQKGYSKTAPMYACVFCGADTPHLSKLCQTCTSIKHTVQQEMVRQGWTSNQLTPALVAKAMHSAMMNSGSPNPLIMSPQAMSSFSTYMSAQSAPGMQVTVTVMGGWNSPAPPFIDIDKEFLSKSKVPAPPKKENKELQKAMESRRINAKWGPE